RPPGFRGRVGWDGRIPRATQPLRQLSGLRACIGGFSFRTAPAEPAARDAAGRSARAGPGAFDIAQRLDLRVARVDLGVLDVLARRPPKTQAARGLLLGRVGSVRRPERRPPPLPVAGGGKRADLDPRRTLDADSRVRFEPARRAGPDLPA